MTSLITLKTKKYPLEIEIRGKTPRAVRRYILRKVKNFNDKLKDEDFRNMYLNEMSGLGELGHWILHGTYIKKIKVMAYFGGRHCTFVEVEVCLRRYQCKETHRTITAFPWWIIRRNEYILPDIMNLLGRNILDGDTAVYICAPLGIDTLAFSAWKETYIEHAIKLLPEALRPMEYKNNDVVSKEITRRLFEQNSLKGEGDPAIDLFGLSAKCARLIGRPFMQSRPHWTKREIKTRVGHDHFFGSFPGSRYNAFYNDTERHLC